MQRIRLFKYRVTPGENITVQIIPSPSLGRLYAANLDEQPQDDPPDGIFRFPVTFPVGDTHNLLIEFRFIASDPGAFYRIVLNGDGPKNKGPYDDIRVEKDDPLPRKHFRFEVVKVSDLK